MSRPLTPAQRLLLMAGAGSACLFLGALIFEALGYAPCRMCYWQRWPHILAGAIGLVLWQGFRLRLNARFVRALGVLGALAAATTGVIGVFHWGVERGLWEGPASCTGGGQLLGLSGDTLLSVTGTPDLVMCDQVSWALMGLSMAGWNAALSFALVGVWLIGLKRL